MHDQDRQIDDFGERDRPMGRLALGLGGVGDGMELRRGTAGADQALREPGDDVVVLGVDHHHRALAPRRREQVEDLAVVQLERVVVM